MAGGLEDDLDRHVEERRRAEAEERRRAEAEERRRAEAEERRRAEAEALDERRRAAELVARESERQRIAALSPLRRWAVTNKGQARLLTGVLLLGLVAVIGVMLFSFLQGKEREALLASCDLARLAEVSADIREQALERWTTCASVQVRQGVAANEAAPPGVLTRLAVDPEVQVRQGVAANEAAPPGVLTRLAVDPAAQVRAAVAHNRATPTETLVAIARDPDSCALLKENGVQRGDYGGMAQPEPWLIDYVVALSQCRSDAVVRGWADWWIAFYRGKGFIA